MGVMECGLVNIGVMHSVIGKGRDECASCGKKKSGSLFLAGRCECYGQCDLRIV